MIKSLISLVAVAFCLFVAYQYIEDKRYKEWNEWANKLQKEKDAWQEPIDRNCRKAVRSISDTNTLRFSQDYISDYDFKKTEKGYAYRISAADATTNENFVSFTCYTDNAGNVIDLVAKKQY